MSTRARISRRGWLGLLVLPLIGCETTSNLAPDAGDTPPPGKAWVLFTVSHDLGPETPVFGKPAGAGVTFEVMMTDSAGKTQSATSTAKKTVLGTAVSEIEGQWAAAHVREVPAGRLTFSSWSLEQNTGVGIRGFTPKRPPPPQTIELAPGSVTYVGNVQANLSWGSNLFGMPLLAGGLPRWQDEAARDLEVAYKAFPKLQGRVSVAPFRVSPWLTPISD